MSDSPIVALAVSDDDTEPRLVPLWAGPDLSDNPEIVISFSEGRVMILVNRAMRALAGHTVSTQP